MNRPPFTASYHTHPWYCDGSGTVDEIVQAAIDAGLSEIGISSHAPLPFETEWTMPPERLDEYVAAVQETQVRYGDRIRVLLGTEIDWIPDRRVIDFQHRFVDAVAFDYRIGSVHFLTQEYPPPSFDGTEQEFRRILDRAYGGDIRAMVEDYYARVREMVERAPISIVGHLDLIKRWNADRTHFQGDEPWYLDAVDRTLDEIASVGLPIELNTAGWNKGLGEPYPAPRILTRARDRGIPVIVNSDSHTPREVTRGFDQAASCLAALTITPTTLQTS